MSQTWTIGILCYNNEGSIKHVYNELREIISIISPETYEIIIVNDGSSDASLEVINQMTALDPHTVIVNHPRNQGIGEAILSVHDRAKMENLCVISGDGETCLQELLQFPKVPENTFVSFYRGRRPSYNWYRHLLSLANKYFNHWILGIDLKDVNWTKIYKTADIKSFQPKLSTSMVESEICFKLLKRGVKVIEAPSNYLPRISGEAMGGSFMSVFRAARGTFSLLTEVILIKLNLS